MISFNHISDQDFRSSSEGREIGYKIYDIFIRCQESFAAAQPNKVEFNFL